ncbi:MAG: squalene/phytoene synthase family protein [Phycisphaeraceae bacterium]|nr:squalene/phytoene synthase family protein [Phycisphaeraceae bacterium]
MTTTGSAFINRTQYLAAREACRTQAADLFFATHFLPSKDRAAIMVIRAVLRQLVEIVDPHAKEHGKPCTNEEPDNHCTKRLAMGETATGGCESCGGESPERRRAVCAAVLDFLYSGQVSGKPELDGFSTIAAEYDLPREYFDRIVNGLSSFLETRRFATWNRLRLSITPFAESEAALAFLVLRAKPEPLTGTEAAQLSAWATALHFAARLPYTSTYWKQGRLILPLEDLIRHNLTESDLDALFTPQEQSNLSKVQLDNGQLAQCWSSLMKQQCERIRTLYHGGTGWLKSLPPSGNRAAAIFGDSIFAQLERFELSNFDPTVTLCTSHRVSLWSRLARIPTAMRLKRRNSKK